MPEKELEGLRYEMELIASHFEENGEQLDGTVDSDSIVCILRNLLQGRRAQFIIDCHGFDVE